jgi:hypothetical protein
MEWLKNLVTGLDNNTVDVARVLWIVGVLSFLGFAGMDVYKSGHFDMANFSLAYGGLLAAGAAGVKIKESCEPPANGK